MVPVLISSLVKTGFKRVLSKPTVSNDSWILVFSDLSDVISQLKSAWISLSSSGSIFESSVQFDHVKESSYDPGQIIVVLYKEKPSYYQTMTG